MLFKLSNLNSNLVLTLGYLNPALNDSAHEELFTRTILSKRSKFAGKSACYPLTSVSQASCPLRHFWREILIFFSLICINKSNESERCWGKNSAKY